MDTAPNVVRKVALFPGKKGAAFVAEHFGIDNLGWADVNAAYAPTPVSTEQVLHPRKYFLDEEPPARIIPDISSDLGKGWMQMTDNTMGEIVIWACLKEYLDDIQAASAAGGWFRRQILGLVGPEVERLPWR